MYVLTPAYGRNYASEFEVKEAYRAGADFVLNSPRGYTYCSIRNFKNEQVELRYDHNRKFVII